MKAIRITLFFFLSGLCTTVTYAQVTIQKTFEWDATPRVYEIGDQRWERWSFPEAVFHDQTPSLPYFHYRFPVAGPGKITARIVSIQTEAFNKGKAVDDEAIRERLDFQLGVERDRNQYIGKLSFVPLIKVGQSYERVRSIELALTHESIPSFSYRGPQPTSSVLNNGQTYKLTVTEEGMHKLSYGFLKDELKIDVDQVDPKQIKIFGNGGGLLPLYVEAERPADLVENRIAVEGEADGRFDESDYILFYAEAANRWQLDTSDMTFRRQQHIYSDENYYYLQISSGNGLRVEERPSLSNTTYEVTTFSDFRRFEEDKVNLFHLWEKTTGSNRDWFGDYFKIARERTYNKLFEFPNIAPNGRTNIKARMAVRSPRNATFSLTVNQNDKNVDGDPIESGLARSTTITLGDNFYFHNYVNFGVLNQEIKLDQDEVDITLAFPQPSGAAESEGWLDYIEINAERQLQMTGQQMRFQQVATIGQAGSRFLLEQAGNGLRIWDITDPLSPTQQAFDLSGNNLSFGANTLSLRSFVAFRPDQPLLSPAAGVPIPNQNLHRLGTEKLDMIIIYHPEFAEAAEQLANHRRAFSQLAVEAVSTEAVYNEFSSGKVDPTAIRDLARMVYDRSASFRYLLLVGDGSFDQKDVYELGANFIPVYETSSFKPLSAFPSDDFYGVLNGNNPNNPLAGDLNIAVGRLPVKTQQEAQASVDKIINYEKDPQTFSDWRNRLVFVGDDEDGSKHTRDANGIADMVIGKYPQYNVDKLYLDAFPQENTPAGPRVPDVNSSIDRSVFKGVLAVTYLGHGGPRGWAQERVLNIVDIKKWTNRQRLPLFITATCTFTSYDDSDFVSAGEETFLNPNGGVVALMTTTRAVFASENEKLTRIVMDNLLSKDQQLLRVGDIMRRSKNEYSGQAENQQKFTLIGDPATIIAKPIFDVQTTAINGRDLTENQTDTLRAFDKVTIAGQVVDQTGKLLENFNGLVYPTVFDKKVNFKTLGQDGDSPVVEFNIQKNVLFKGKASVKTGRFEFTFVVPKDINFEFGPGKISYYAADASEMVDAAGYFEDVVIGGASDNLLADKEGPQVDVFMNTIDFVFGGITDENPTLLVVLEDENGINVVGNSIGHDLEAVLDDNTQNSFLLNDFYEAKQDDYTQGEVRYPLNALEEGLHTLQVKAWDVANNPSEGYTEFVVANTAEVALKHVLNYPNPFTDQTCFQFDHNLSGQEMDVLIQIYTVSGRLVKTLEQTLITDGAIRLDDCISWDGRDDFGDRLAKGVYLYKVSVRVNSASPLQGESDFQKLVLLK